MAKKVALLVKTEFVTRVIVEVEDDFNENAKGELFYAWDAAIPACSVTERQLLDGLNEKLAKQVADKECTYMAITEVNNDLENPYRFINPNE